ncbi:hypothetical protein CE195_12595, partial [Sodalis-like symbiont of Philaenus spumarius]
MHCPHCHSDEMSRHGLWPIDN